MNLTEIAERLSSLAIKSQSINDKITGIAVLCDIQPKLWVSIVKTALVVLLRESLRVSKLDVMTSPRQVPS